MNRKYLILFLFIVLISAIYLPKSLSSKEEMIFVIERGEGSKEISFNLEKADLIYWAPIFRAYIYLRGVQGNLQAGFYELSPSMSIYKIADKFVEGDVKKSEITIPEGYDSEEIYQKLIGITEVNLADLKELEGYLFPDTYEIPYGTDGEEIIDMMVDNFNKKITPDLKEEIDKQGKTLEEIVIMASILEKEVKTKEEKELAAGILWKRLKVGMPLQVDVDMETYKRLGLPAHPISNPGLESIKAAIYPKSSLYWYYLSTPEGETIFSKTLEEHNIARAKYLK